MTDEEIEADCALSPSRVSPSSCWQTPLLLGTLTGPQQRCLHPPGCWHSKQLQQVQAVDRTCVVCFTLPHQKKKKDYRIYGHPLFGCVFHCERIQHLLFRLKTVSVHIWHRSNFASVDCSETREIPDVKNMHLQEGTAGSTLEHQ